jgi:MtrB/PioB family decaheme-associated outer membrane protein
MLMKKINCATQHRPLKPLALAVALALAAPGAVLAEPLGVPLTRGADMTRYDSNYVELGAGYNDNNSYKFGEFSGLYKDDAFLIGNANLRKRLDDQGHYLNAFGYNLGLEPTVGAEYGQQGRFWVNGGYQQIKRYQFDDAQFIYNGLGTSNLTLPAGCGGFAQPPTATAAQVNNCLQTYDIKQERDIYKLGGGFYVGDWKVSVNYRQDNRDGSKLIGAVMGNSGGNPRSAILPYDLNDSTKQVEATASWTGKDVQTQISFWYSKYDDNSNSLTWQDAYTNAWGAAGATAAYPTGFGRLGLMPSNDFWQLKGTTGWNVTPTSRLTGTLAYSESKQDDAYLPYTVNPNLSVTTALPRSSLNGEIKNTLLDLSYLSRPLSKLSLKLNYHYDKHDNNTPSDWYSYVGGDTTDQTPIPPGTDPNTIASSRVRMNLPPSTEENRFTIDGTYRLMMRTQLRGWYKYTRINYQESEDEFRSNTTDNEVGAEIRRIMSEKFTGALRGSYDQRRGSDFSQQRPYNASYTTAQTVGGSAIDNIPTMRQFFVADYNKSLVGVTGTFSATERVSFGTRADYYTMDFKGPDCGGTNDQVAPYVPMPAECLGRQKAQGQSYTLDGSATLSEPLSLFAFYTYQQLKTDQTSRSWTGGNVAQATSTAQDWNATIKNSDNTVGLGVNYRPESKRYDFGTQYVYSDGTGSYTLGGPATVGTAPVPDVKTRLNSFQLYGKYQYSKTMAIRVNYWYQKYHTSDWAFDNSTATSTNNVLLTGQQSPNYTNNVIGISFAYSGF